MTDAKFEGFRRSYKWLFRLPGTCTMVAVVSGTLLLELVLSIAVNYSVQELAKNLLAVFLPYIASHIVDRKILTWRRILGFFTVFLILLLPAILLRKTPVVASTAVVLLSFLVFIATSGEASLVIFLSSYLALLYFLYPQFFLPSLVEISLYVLASLPVLYNIDRRVRKVTGVGGLKFLNGFLRYALAGEKNKIEECIKASSSRRTIPIHVFTFRDNGEVLGRLVVSGVHPGPLRTLGSSTIPEKVVTRCLRSVFLKAPAGHGENLALSNEVDRVADAICDVTPSSEESTEATLGFAQGKLVNSLSIKLSNGVTLCFLDPQIPMEDIPAILREEFESRGVVLVDLHNSISREYLQLPDDPEDSPELYLEVKQTIQESLSSEIARGRIKAGFAWSSYSDGITVGKAGVSCVVVEVGGKTVGILSFDGNNMTPDFKSKLFRELGKEVDHLIVGTTDTHVMTGTFQGVDYYPVGTVNDNTLLDVAQKCLSEARENMKESSVSHGIFPVNSYFMDSAKLKGLSLATRLNVRDGLALATLAFLSYVILLTIG
ncbi:DUF2070 family protein [Infirmifilum lucidum]|uniref:DUF2070 family protein n=1 Tax=Infirmifilum lucidum TaxID=2776706 RepID=A0A7L9FGW4_9CREN|nr:DUF2070 family protein [Infirmifilum lucidum]QOJ78184.1 DUF2070 family protein [Infirmifilum lucidum]